jgi:tetratricopeptide (TPR) repeat protein
LGSLLVASGCQMSQVSRLRGPGSSSLVEPIASGSKHKDELLPAHERAQVCVETATLLEKQGKVADAIAFYEQARQLHPRVENLSWKLAVLYDQVGDFDSARQEYEKAYKARPRSADLCNDIGYSHYNRGNWKEAETWFRKAVDLDGSHERAWTHLGMTLAQQNRTQESLVAFQNVVSEAEAQSNLSFVLASQGKHDQARQTSYEALQKNGDLERTRRLIQVVDKGKTPYKQSIPSEITPTAAVVPAPSADIARPMPAASPARRVEPAPTAAPADGGVSGTVIFSVE